MIAGRGRGGEGKGIDQQKHFCRRGEVTMNGMELSCVAAGMKGQRSRFGGERGL